MGGKVKRAPVHLPAAGILRTDDDELYSAGFYDYESRGGFCLAEWCENIPWALPADYIRVTVAKTGAENDRRITVERITREELQQ